jgi:hypothetical protein
MSGYQSNIPSLLSDQINALFDVEALLELVSMHGMEDADGPVHRAAEMALERLRGAIKELEALDA